MFFIATHVVVNQSVRRNSCREDDCTSAQYCVDFFHQNSSNARILEGAEKTVRPAKVPRAAYHPRLARRYSGVYVYWWGTHVARDYYVGTLRGNRLFYGCSKRFHLSGDNSRDRTHQHSFNLFIGHERKKSYVTHQVSVTCVNYNPPSV